MEQLFTIGTLLGVLHSTIRLATPYLYAAIGETIGQRSGLLNLGVEGMMLMGAYVGFYVVFTTARSRRSCRAPRPTPSGSGCSWPGRALSH
ncbi:hypothetical protein K2Z83_15500 [Oscillochloris sp. ZM17-4]|uniref:ABC transporter permease subunit n=1 Tax=Oscillochloris sp. ZM17-4 TaxID=2866714 RepID=UPI001C73B962|nr:hypothetical protein [Oscillochloris sp. ZM17-4]MBX0329083.1 hypothetical protein [Oscillochloris sp. ZM17-4]